VVLTAAAVLSFDALRGLAVAVGITGSLWALQLAWLLPVAVDAGAAVSCAVWLGGRTTPDAARFAGRMTWALLAVTVAGNAGQLGMHAHGITPPWWVSVLVGTIPPAVVGAVVHLLVLVGRPALAPVAGEELDDPMTDEPPADPPQGGDRVAQLLAEGAGRRRLARELDIPESRARALLDDHRAAQGSSARPELTVNGSAPGAAGDGVVAG
jgi:Protein of unknown function (DUF2637)